MVCAYGIALSDVLRWKAWEGDFFLACLSTVYEMARRACLIDGFVMDLLTPTKFPSTVDLRETISPLVQAFAHSCFGPVSAALISSRDFVDGLDELTMSTNNLEFVIEKSQVHSNLVLGGINWPFHSILLSLISVL